MTNSRLNDVNVLKRELIGLFEHIQRIRKEIASIRKPGAAEDEDHFAKMSDELDAIVAATEQATDTIMENVETMEDVVNQVRTMVSDNAAAVALLDKFPEMTGNVFEACAFQDITGQRITKVVNSLQYVEKRVNTLINMWGPDKLADVDPVRDAEPEDEYKKYLHGPQLQGEGVSQADVDALFGEGTAPAQPAPPAQKPAPPQPEPDKKAAAPQPAPAKPGPPKPQPAAAKPAPVRPGQEGKGEDDGPALNQDDIDALFD